MCITFETADVIVVPQFFAGYLWPSIALQVQNRGLKHHSFIHFTYDHMSGNTLCTMLIANMCTISDDNVDFHCKTAKVEHHISIN